MRIRTSKRPDNCPASKAYSLQLRLFAAVTAAIATTTTVAAATAITAIAATATAATRTTAEAAAATTTTAPAKATAFTAAAKAAGTRCALFARTGDIHREGAAFHLETVELLDGFLCLFGAAHRDEREATGATGELVEDNFNDTDGASLTKQSLKVLRSASEG